MHAGHPPEPISGPTFEQLGGNEGTVSTFDHEKRQLYVLGKLKGFRPGQPPASGAWSIVQIDVDAHAVTAHPEIKSDINPIYGAVGLDDMAWAAPPGIHSQYHVDVF